MSREFADGQGLKKLIESNNWTLYDLTPFTETNTKPEFEALQKAGPAKRYVFGGHYLFTPKLRDGKSLREVYAVTKGLGPCLLIEDPNHARWSALDVKPKVAPLYFLGRAPDTEHFAIFSRLSFDNINGGDYVIAWTPEDAYPNSDSVFMRADLALDTFEKYFRIVQLQSPEGN